MVKRDASLSPGLQQEGLKASLAEMQSLNQKLSAANRRLQARIVALETVNATNDLLAGTDTDRRLALAMQAVAGMVYDCNLSTDQTYRSEGMERLIGTPAEEAEPSASWWRDRVHPDDRAAMRACFEQALRGDETGFDLEYRVRHADGGWVDVWDRGLIVRDGDGRATRAVGVALDISARKRAEERSRMLTAELDHRIKNILVTIAAVARQTSVGKASVEAFVQTLTGRMQAMGRAHSLLSLSRWEGASLQTLVADELAPYGASEEGFGIQGEPMLLRPKAAQALAMALHELATNAAKHGAFASPGGRVEVTWRRAEEDQAVVLVWHETAHRPIAPPGASGYGSIVLEQLLPHELGARVTLDYHPAGLVCTLQIPQTQFRQEPARECSARNPRASSEAGPARSSG